jgi:hypothetical protein
MPLDPKSETLLLKVHPGLARRVQVKALTEQIEAAKLTEAANAKDTNKEKK